MRQEDDADEIEEADEESHGEWCWFAWVSCPWAIKIATVLEMLLLEVVERDCFRVGCDMR